MKDNNGKIILAIVAMFVVALGIIGVTYAYFTAAVQGNEEDAISVQVQAGVLEINYTNSNKIEAQNLVPGWINDGNHYYDPVASIDADGHVTAATKGATNALITNPGKADGIATPATITVTNKNSTEAATYAIRLIDIDNGLEDPENFFVTLYETTTADATTGGTKVWRGNLAESGTQVIVPAAQTIDVSSTVGKYYYIALEYQNITDTQNASMGKSVTATVDVIGVSQNNAKTGWVDADGNPVTFVASL